jgi:hypothetical protein
MREKQNKKIKNRCKKFNRKYNRINLPVYWSDANLTGIAMTTADFAIQATFGIKAKGAVEIFERGSLGFRVLRGAAFASCFALRE